MPTTLEPLTEEPKFAVQFNVTNDALAEMRDRLATTLLPGPVASLFIGMRCNKKHRNINC